MTTVQTVLCKCHMPTHRWDRDLCSECGSLIPIGPEDVDAADAEREAICAMLVKLSPVGAGYATAIRDWAMTRARLSQVREGKHER